MAIGSDEKPIHGQSRNARSKSVHQLTGVDTPVRYRANPH
jgi:hypothetical protein